MAGDRIKGITIEIDGDTTNLQKAIKSANAEISSSQSSLKDIDKLLKVDPGNTALLEQKYKYLGTSIDATSSKLGTLQNAQAQMASEGKVGTEEWDKLQREIVETEQKLSSLKKEYKDFGSVASQQIKAVGDKMQDVGSKMSDVGSSLTTKVSLPIAAVGAAGVKNFAEVDKTMQLANKTMEASNQSLSDTVDWSGYLSDAMKEAAANSIYGMNDAATATLNFARAGLNAEEAAAALAPAMNLAAGEGGDLDTVSGGLVATINGFHGTFDEAGRYADVFAAACNNSALDVNSLSGAMSVAAPIFSAAGYGVEEASLAMGLMGNAGIEASVAANSLKTGMARLISPAKEGQNALKKLGFAAGSAEDNEEKLLKAQHKLEEKQAALTAKQQKYNEAVKKYGESSSQALNAKTALIKAENGLEEAQNAVNLLTTASAEGMGEYAALMVDTEGNMRPFTEIIGDLHNKFGELSEEEQIAAASAIFGKNQMAPWLALINTAPEDVDNLNDALRNCTGTTDEMAKTMMGGFGGSIERLKSSVDVLGYSFGEALAPTIQHVVDFIQDLTDKFNAMSPKTKEMIAKIGMIVALLGPTLLIGGKITSGIGVMVSGFGTLVGKVGQAGSTIGGFIGKFSQVGSAASGATKGIGGLSSAASSAAGPVASSATSVGKLSQNALGLIAAGAGILLAAAGIALLAQSAIAIANAGPGAAVAMAALVAVLALLAVGAAALAPALAAGAVGLVAFGAALALVGVGVLAASAGMALLASQFPIISEYGKTAAENIVLLGEAMVVFSGGAVIAGGASVILAGGVAALAVGLLGLGAGATVAAAGTTLLAAGVTLLSGGVILLSAGVLTLGAGLTICGAALVVIGGNANDAASGFTALAAACTAAFIPIAAGSGSTLVLDVALAALVVTLGLSTAAAVALDVAMIALAVEMETIAGASKSAASDLDSMVSAVDVVETGLSSLKNTVKNALKEFVDAFKKSSPDAQAEARTMATGITTEISTGMANTKQAYSNSLMQMATDTSAKMSQMLQSIKTSIQQIENAFRNAKFQFNQNIALPHFKMSGDFNAKTGATPEFSVSWYRKAMEDGIILNSPTIFGMSGNNLLGAGEAGPEAVVGTESLKSMITDAVESADSSVGPFNFTINMGMKKFDTFVAEAIQRNDLKSGGR